MKDIDFNQVESITVDENVDEGFALITINYPDHAHQFTVYSEQELDTFKTAMYNAMFDRKTGPH